MLNSVPSGEKSRVTPPPRRYRSKGLLDEMLYLDIDSIRMLDSYNRSHNDDHPTLLPPRRRLSSRDSDEIDRIVAMSG